MYTCWSKSLLYGCYDATSCSKYVLYDANCHGCLKEGWQDGRRSPARRGIENVPNKGWRRCHRSPSAQYDQSLSYSYLHHQNGLYGIDWMGRRWRMPKEWKREGCKTEDQKNIRKIHQKSRWRAQEGHAGLVEAGAADKQSRTAIIEMKLKYIFQLIIVSESPAFP